MKNSELNKILRAAKVPERSERFWRELPQRISARLHWKANAAQERKHNHFFLRLEWILGGVAACLLAGFFIGHWRGRTEATAGSGLLQNEKIIREMLAMFPNRVRAVVQDEHGLNVVLADQDNVPVSTPLWLKVCDGKNCSFVVTFSGQQIQIGRQEVTILADPQGKIILAGDNFLWSNGKALLADGNLKIQAKALTAVVL
jgi:hypothetical protein